MSAGIRPLCLRLSLLDHEGSVSLVRRIIRATREYGDVEQHLSDRDVLQAYRRLPLRLVDDAEYVRAVGTCLCEGEAQAQDRRHVVELSNGVIIVVPDSRKPR
ncbi:hypothetical protein [Paraburkholderia ferrariae]|uniref:Uncharacterized protein n=1 Tax=Paraburkholderia ferrariae TaxID=386056 RepID=A0ABU9RP73_9BURK